jgi:hypothetical protein
MRLRCSLIRLRPLTPDPDHSFGRAPRDHPGLYNEEGFWSSFPTVSAGSEFESLERAPQLGPSKGSMKREPVTQRSDDMRKEYDLSKLAGGVRGKYYRQATARTNLVLIEPDLANMFPDSEAVNRALRVLADAAQTASASKRRRSR